MGTLRYAAAVVGAAETTGLGRVPNMSSKQLHLDAARNTMRDCGITPKQIDGIATVQMGVTELAQNLGIIPNWIDTTNVGGTSFTIHVRHAAAAIASGLCQTVLVVMGQSGHSLVGEMRQRTGVVAETTAPRRDNSLGGQFQEPFGAIGPTNAFGLGVLRYMKETGTTHEQLASVAVAQRKWANKVPRALYRDLITVEDVLNSRMISYPFHLLECCLITDGGCAVIVTSAERAKDFPTPPVYILGTGEAVETPLVAHMKDMTSSEGYRASSRKAFDEAQVRHSDVNHLQVYDAFAHLPIYALEDIGFVKRGEAGAFIAEGHTSPGGRLPTNTNGGALSYTHSGMYGLFNFQESIRQVRGQAPHQVPGVKVAFNQGIGGMFNGFGSIILTNEAPHG